MKAWRAAIHGVTKTQTRLSNWTTAAAAWLCWSLSKSREWKKKKTKTSPLPISCELALFLLLGNTALLLSPNDFRLSKSNKDSSRNKKKLSSSHDCAWEETLELSAEELILSHCGVREDSWVLCTARTSNQSILKGINPEYSLEELILKLKFQSFGHLMGRADRMKRPGKDWRQQEKGTTEDEMVGWHHWLDGHEFEQALGVGDGQGSLAFCNPSGAESYTIQRLNWTELGFSAHKGLLKTRTRVLLTPSLTTGQEESSGPRR